ncbi:hypothetical protein [Shinella sp.]|uniref:hypothetical protein n=1 Tax=Shinella sp. TaxID=1870904 RepID=UPI0028B23D31|nr:hypothetical protein [Shinella sp.]
MTHQFYAGMQVVCIDDQVPLEGGKTVKDANLTEGDIFTLRWVGMASHYVFGDYLGVKLEGIDSKFGEAWGLSDAPYAARRFRPLVKDRLGSLRALLVPGQPLAPSTEEPRRRGKVKEEEKV